MDELQNIMVEHLNSFYLGDSKNYDIDYFGIAGEVFFYALLMKKPCFHVEQEYRFCFLIDNLLPQTIEVQYRTAKNILIPYIEIPIFDKETGIFACESVTIGPKNNIDIAKFGIEHFAKNEKLKIRVEKSDIPLRF